MFKKLLAALLLTGFSLNVHAHALSESSLFESHESKQCGGHRHRSFYDLTVRNRLNANLLTVTGNEIVGGNVAVNGSVIASSYLTPTGPLFTGLRNYAVLSNQVAVFDGDNIPWTPASVGNTSAGITVDGAGFITLPTSGLFLVQYTVRLTRSPVNGTNGAIVQLQQTVAGVPTNITQASINSNTSIDGVDNLEPESQPQITGYALINVTSATNNVLNLAINLNGSNISIPAASGIDANAQLTILQIN
jgi:hypothetical protein